MTLRLEQRVKKLNGIEDRQLQTKKIHYDIAYDSERHTRKR